MKTLAISFLLVSVSLGMEREESLRSSTLSQDRHIPVIHDMTVGGRNVENLEKPISSRHRKPIFDKKEDCIQAINTQEAHTTKQYFSSQNRKKIFSKKEDLRLGGGKIGELNQENEKEAYTPVNKLGDSSRKSSFEDRSIAKEVYYTGPRHYIYFVDVKSNNFVNSIPKQLYNPPLKAPEPDFKHRNIITPTKAPSVADIERACQANGYSLKKGNIKAQESYYTPDNVLQPFNPEKSARKSSFGKIRELKSKMIESRNKTEAVRCFYDSVKEVESKEYSRCTIGGNLKLGRVPKKKIFSENLILGGCKKDNTCKLKYSFRENKVLPVIIRK